MPTQEDFKHSDDFLESLSHWPVVSSYRVHKLVFQSINHLCFHYKMIRNLRGVDLISTYIKAAIGILYSYIISHPYHYSGQHIRNKNCSSSATIGKISSFVADPRSEQFPKEIIVRETTETPRPPRTKGNGGWNSTIVQE